MVETGPRKVILSDGKEMPVIGLGTFSIHDSVLISQAIVDVGYRHVDTAPLYRNEEAVGKGVKDAIATGKVTRQYLWVTTKLWHNRYDDPEGSLRDSLNRLGLDYVDLFLIHWPMNGFAKHKVPMHKLWANMEDLVEKGLTKSIGVSNFNLQLLADLLTYAKIKPVCNQI